MSDDEIMKAVQPYWSRADGITREELIDRLRAHIAELEGIHADQLAGWKEKAELLDAECASLKAERDDWRARVAELEAGKLSGFFLPYAITDDEAKELADPATFIASVRNLRAENARLRERCRTTAQLLIDAVGAEGPTDCDEAARRAVAVIAKLRAALEAVDNALMDAMQADCENGVAWLNEKAAAVYLKDFPATKRAIDFCINTTRAEALK